MELIGEHALQSQLSASKFTSIKQDDFSIGIEQELLQFLLSEDHIGAYKYLAQSRDRKIDKENAVERKMPAILL